MATFIHSENMVLESAILMPDAGPCEASIWEEASSWLALLPTLFIIVSGRIQTDTGPLLSGLPRWKRTPWNVE